MDTPRPPQTLRIGEVAALAGVSVDTLRYYERRGLLPAPRRRPSGYRVYSAAAVRHVRAIKWAQSLGFRLREVPLLLRGDHASRLDAGRRAALLAKRTEVTARLRGLARVRTILTALAACRCRGACPLVERAVAGQRSARERRRP